MFLYVFIALIDTISGKTFINYKCQFKYIKAIQVFKVWQTACSILTHSQSDFL